MSRFKPNRRASRPPANLPSRVSVSQTDVVVKSPTVTETASDIPEAPREAPNSSLKRIAFNCTLLFLFLRFSFIHEFLSEKLGIDTHLVVIFGGLAFVTALMAGGMGRAFQKRSTWMWCGFAAWVACAAFASTWRGGSLPLAVSYLRTTFPLVLLIPAVAYTKTDLRKIVNVIGLAGIAVVVIGFLLGNSEEGRLEIETGGTSTIGNSNDFAAYLVFILPAMIYLLFARERLLIIKLLGVPIVGAAIYLTLHTGSRGGLVGIIAALLYTAAIGSNKVRAGVLLGVPVLFLSTLPFLPQKTIQRLEYVFIPDPQGPDESKMQREALFWASVRMSLAHPLLGVGPGRFQENQATVANERGDRGMWHETHNAYTQVSSECGIPALIFFLGALFMTIGALRKTKRADLPILSSIATTLLIMVTGYAACIIFLSQAYAFNLLAVTGMANALTDATHSEEPSDHPMEVQSDSRPLPV